MRLLVLERMSSFAVREIAERILDSALVRAQLAFVPMGGVRLASFSNGPLQDLVRHHLGDDAADAFLEDMQPLLKLNIDEEEISSVRPRVPDSARIHVETRAFADTTSQTQLRAADKYTPAVPAGPTTSAPTVRPDSDAALVVVISSQDPTRAFALGAALGASVEMRVVDDIVELVDTLLELQDRTPFLVLDGVAPALHPLTLAATLPELPEGLTIVLWGYDGSSLIELRAMVDGASGFRTFGSDVEPDDLASLLRLA
jgi:hypothetical protein